MLLAQTSNGSVTDAEVRAKLVPFKCAVYQPACKQIHYPDEIDGVEQRVQESNDAPASENGEHGGSSVAAGTASQRVDEAN
ncbi:hypothetical protein [Caballeronia sordidicola]|uniref:Uncharacterized protein n=1 Tax=Caballeronia sordidicola TaxID=196367 RepID=A0A226WUB9_CABSO|nr:hypothetical protein [Caballeronia sordidicola]OXC74400.1 hypothetical protein BSU04_32065 [Caballeronia sordidicola]